jgi:hypothetical protein
MSKKFNNPNGAKECRGTNLVAIKKTRGAGGETRMGPLISMKQSVHYKKS